MITSTKDTLSALRGGAFIERVDHTRFFLIEGPESSRQRLSAATVRRMVAANEIMRTDDHTSRIRETWMATK